MAGVLTFGVSACGASSGPPSGASNSGTASSSTTSGTAPLSKSAYVSQANAACKAANDQLTSSGSTLPNSGDPSKATAADLPGWSRGLQQIASVAQVVIGQLEALTPPAADAATVSGFLSKQSAALADLQKAQSAAAAGDLSGFQSAMDTAASVGKASDRAESAYGLTDCGGSS